MRSCLTFSLGAFALAQLSFATPLNYADTDNIDVAGTSAGHEELAARARMPSSRSWTTTRQSAASTISTTSPRSAVTSFTAIPTDNAGYAVYKTFTQDEWCRTASSTANGYSQACIDGNWGTFWARTVTSEETDGLVERAYPTSFSPIPTDNAAYAAMTQSQHSAWCKTAKKTAPGYSRACIDGIWDSLYHRTAAPQKRGGRINGTPLESLTGFKTLSGEAAEAYRSSLFHYCQTADKKAPGFNTRACAGGVWADLHRRADATALDGAQPTGTVLPSSATVEVVEHEITDTPQADSVFERAVQDHQGDRQDNPRPTREQNAYFSSLQAACPTATDPFMREKCSSMSSFYAKATVTSYSWSGMDGPPRNGTAPTRTGRPRSGGGSSPTTASTTVLHKRADPSDQPTTLATRTRGELGEHAVHKDTGKLVNELEHEKRADDTAAAATTPSLAREGPGNGGGHGPHKTMGRPVHELEHEHERRAHASAMQANVHCQGGGVGCRTAVVAAAAAAAATLAI